MEKVYISYPPLMGLGPLAPLISLIESNGYEVVHRKEGIQGKDNCEILTCHHVVFVLPSFDWCASINNLQRSIKEDLEIAISSDKSLYVYYRTRSGDKLMYDANAIGDLFSGIQGTRNLAPFMQPTKQKPIPVLEHKAEEAVVFLNTKDVRVLLLLTIL